MQIEIIRYYDTNKWGRLKGFVTWNNLPSGDLLRTANFCDEQYNLSFMEPGEQFVIYRYPVP
jgi:hypothetical protein